VNKREVVSPGQLGLLFFAFLTGSSIINIPSPLIAKAESGAWISLLLSGGAGLIFLGCLLFLHRRYPSLTLAEYSAKLIGFWPAALLSVMPLLFMLYMHTAIVLDIGLFMESSMLRETPVYAFTSLVFMVSALTARAGLEVMARMFAVILPLMLLFVFGVLLLAVGHYQVEFLAPAMPDGIRPILNGAFFSYGFPYAEVFLFGMLMPFVRKQKSGPLGRVMGVSLLLSIVTLCLSVVCTIMLFGPLAPVKKYSLYEVARMIEVQEIITRIESLIGFSLIVGSYMKTTIVLYALCLYLSQILKLKDYRILIMPVSLIAFLHSLIGFTSDMQWVEMVSVVHPIWITFAFVAPLLLLTVVALVRIPFEPSAPSGAPLTGTTGQSGTPEMSGKSGQPGMPDTSDSQPSDSSSASATSGQPSRTLSGASEPSNSPNPSSQHSSDSTNTSNSPDAAAPQDRNEHVTPTQPSASSRSRKSSRKGAATKPFKLPRQLKPPSTDNG
jgi:spore germination protein (amino acid permease)